IAPARSPRCSRRWPRSARTCSTSRMSGWRPGFWSMRPRCCYRWRRAAPATAMRSRPVCAGPATRSNSSERSPWPPPPPPAPPRGYLAVSRPWLTGSASGACPRGPPTPPTPSPSPPHVSRDKASGVARAARGGGLEVAAAGLFPLDRLEQGLEVALAEPLRAVPLDQLEEHGRPVLDRLGAHLQQVAVLVPVGEDLLGGQFGERYSGLAHLAFELLVVGVRGVEELDSCGLHGTHRGRDVVGGQRDVLHPGAIVELQVLVDLRLLLARCGLVDRELDL